MLWGFLLQPVNLCYNTPTLGGQGSIMILWNLELLVNRPLDFIMLMAAIGFALIVAITFHEFSHGLMAYRLGDEVRVRLVEAIPTAGALRFEMLSEGKRLTGAASRVPKGRRYSSRPRRPRSR